MNGARHTISVTELKRLLHELKEKGSGVCIRFRLMGEMWHQNFTRIVLISDAKVLMFDEHFSKSVLIPDISNVIQFEIDNRFQIYQPFYHYDVKPMDEFRLKD